MRMCRGIQLALLYGIIFSSAYTVQGCGQDPWDHDSRFQESGIRKLILFRKNSNETVKSIIALFISVRVCHTNSFIILGGCGITNVENS